MRSGVASSKGKGCKSERGGMTTSKFEGGRFYGTVVNEWRVGNLSFSESVYPASAQISRHVHPRAYFSILLHGSYRETYSGGVRECGPATAVLHPPGEMHSDQFLEAGGRIFRFELVSDEAASWLDRQIRATAELRNGRVRGFGGTTLLGEPQS